MVDANAILNERKSTDKSSLYWSAKALADVYSSPSDLNKGSFLRATSCMPWNLCVTCAMAPCVGYLTAKIWVVLELVVELDSWIIKLEPLRRGDLF